MPTTAAFSMQGAAFYNKDYVLLVVMVVACLLFAMLAYIGRGSFFRWVDKQYEKNSGSSF
jgi:nitrate/nitrite transporter NarK